MTRFLALLLALSLVIAPTAVFAHDGEMPVVFCGDLDDETCDLLHESQEVMLEVASYVGNSEISFSLQNVPGVPLKDASVTINAAQVTYLDPDYAAEMRDMMMGAKEAMQDDMKGFIEDYFAMTADLYNRLSFDIQMDIALSDDIAEFLSNESGLDIPTELSLDMVLLDGVMYMNLDDIASALPEAGVPEGWIGMEIAKLMEEQMATSLDNMDSKEMQSQMASMSVALGMLNAGSDEAIQEALNDIVIMERLEDGEVDGTEVAQVQGTVDFAALLTNETILGMIFDAIEASGQDVSQLDGMNPEEVAGMLQLVAPMITQGIEWSQTQMIGLDDGLLYGQAIEMNWDMASVLQLAAMGMGGGRPAKRAKDKPTFQLSAMLTQSDFDDAPEIVAPEDATIIPLDELQ